jgi:hypothetical protein
MGRPKSTFELFYLFDDGSIEMLWYQPLGNIQLLRSVSQLLRRAHCLIRKSNGYYYSRIIPLGAQLRQPIHSEVMYIDSDTRKLQ